jgi:transposase-like protein
MQTEIFLRELGQWTLQRLMDLKIPKLRHGSYRPAFLDPRKALERALVAVV